MLAKILSAAHFGLKTIPVEVEINVATAGFPGFNIIGLPNKEIEEAKERVKTALSNSGFAFPTAKIVVNLAPADIPKEGSHYDLPIAVGILSAIGVIGGLAPRSPDGHRDEVGFFYGELSLDGSLRHSKGVFLLGLAAKEEKIKNIFVPSLSANEASVIKGINVYPVDCLKQLINHLNGIAVIQKLEKIGTEEILEEAL
ncbi:magnesium chelatase, partial [Patescibacteria group bacterium]|nr:magnesium chelatase [Patescibacteria group bacterium]